MGEILGAGIGSVRAMFSNMAVVVIAAGLALMVGHQILVKTSDAIFTNRRRVSSHNR
jgi:hypothetical protein